MGSNVANKRSICHKAPVRMVQRRDRLDGLPVYVCLVCYSDSPTYYKLNKGEYDLIDILSLSSSSNTSGGSEQHDISLVGGVEGELGYVVYRGDTEACLRLLKRAITKPEHHYNGAGYQDPEPENK